MTPIVFGTPERRLLGLYHEPAGGKAHGAVLLCNPFGHEAIRVHRLYRVLADRLSRSGLAVLRFDYHATGDSPGDDDAGDIEGWAADVLQADAELRVRSGTQDLRWLGARLGATVAARAATLARTPPSSLVLWDPIVDGAGYARLLRAKHVEALELTYCIPDPRWRDALEQSTTVAPEEAIGFAVSPTLGHQLLQLRAATLPLPPAQALRLIHRTDDRQGIDWLGSTSVASRSAVTEVLDHAIVWTADPQINDAVVPNEVLVRLTAALEQQA